MNLLTVFLIVLCAVLFYILTMICKKNKRKSENKRTKSKFGVTSDKTLIFFAPWCGHCKNAMPEFIKAAENNDKIKLINSDDPGSKKLMQQYKINAFPTIQKTSGEKFNGNPDVNSLNNFANSE